MPPASGSALVQLLERRLRGGMGGGSRRSPVAPSKRSSVVCASSPQRLAVAAVVRRVEPVGVVLAVVFDRVRRLPQKTQKRVVVAFDPERDHYLDNNDHSCGVVAFGERRST